MIRALLATGVVFLAGLAQTAGAVGPTGLLAGKTLISFGCPGPVKEGGPDCSPWRPFSDARLSVAGRVIVSDGSGRFAVHLRAGTYVVKTLPMPHARGGSRIVVTVRAGLTTRVVLRYDGFPKMV